MKLWDKVECISDDFDEAHPDCLPTMEWPRKGTVYTIIGIRRGPWRSGVSEGLILAEFAYARGFDARAFRPLNEQQNAQQAALQPEPSPA